MTLRISRPAGVMALSLFFAAGSMVSFTAGLSLVFAGGRLEWVWRINPRAREAFSGIGEWAVLLLLAVCASCALAALGLWRQPPSSPSGRVPGEIQSNSKALSVHPGCFATRRQPAALDGLPGVGDLWRGKKGFPGICR